MADDYALATRFRDMIDARVEALVDKIRPRANYAQVQVIDRVNRVLTVVYPGPIEDQTPIDIPVRGTDFPAVVGQYVRIDGEPGNRVATSPQLVDSVVDKVISTAHEFAGGTPHALKELDPAATEPFSAYGPGAGYSAWDRTLTNKRSVIFTDNNEFVVWKSDIGNQLKVKALGTTAALKGLVAGTDAEITSEPLETGGALSGLRLRHRDNATKQSIIYATGDELRWWKDNADRMILRANNRLRANAGVEVGTQGWFVRENGALIEFCDAAGTGHFQMTVGTGPKDFIASNDIITNGGRFSGGAVHNSAAILNTAGSENVLWFDWVDPDGSGRCVDFWIDATLVLRIRNRAGGII